MVSDVVDQSINQSVLLYIFHTGDYKIHNTQLILADKKIFNIEME